MRILRVVTLGSATGRFGGPFDTSLRQARLAHAAGHRVAVLFGVERGDQPDQVNSPATLYPVVVRPLTKRRHFSTLFSISMVRTAWRLARSADLVHVSMARDIIPIVAALFALLHKRRLILQPHGMLTTRSSANRLLDRATQIVLTRAHRVIALTEDESLELQQQYRLENLKVAILGNPIDPAAYSHTHHRTDPPHALFLARLHPRKRPEDFVEAARRSHDAGWNDRYVIAGPDGGSLEHLIPVIENLDTVEYLGSISPHRVASQVALAGVFVLCSEGEPWGNVLISALAMGVPCIVTASSALAKPLEAAGAALIIKDRDPDALASAVHSLLTDASLSSQMGANGRRFTEENLSEDRQSRSLLAIYQA